VMPPSFVLATVVAVFIPARLSTACPAHPMDCALSPPNGTGDPAIFRAVCVAHTQPAEAPTSRCLPWPASAAAGEFKCGCCGHPLFNASDLFNAGTGWPAFHKEIAGGICQPGGSSTEVVCANCGAHLGDFDAAPPAHFCIDGVCLTPPPNHVFGNGCEAKKTTWHRAIKSDDDSEEVAAAVAPTAKMVECVDKGLFRYAEPVKGYIGVRPPALHPAWQCRGRTL
jgi:peptide methionine sulfoxide reductase MsrB